MPCVLHFSQDQVGSAEQRQAYWNYALVASALGFDPDEHALLRICDKLLCLILLKDKRELVEELCLLDIPDRVPPVSDLDP